MENIAMDKTAENLARGSEMLETLSGVKADIAEQWAKTAEAQKTLAANVARIREFIDKSDKIVADVAEAMEVHRQACEESAAFLSDRQAELSAEYGRVMDTLNETMGGAVGTLFLSSEELAEQEAARAAEEAAARVVTREEALATLGLTEESFAAMVAAGEAEGQDEAPAEGLDADQAADGVDADQGEPAGLPEDDGPETSPDEEADDGAEAKGEETEDETAVDEAAVGAYVQDFLASKGLSMDDLLALASKGAAGEARREDKQPAPEPEKEAADETLVIEPIHVEPVSAPAAESVDMSALDAMISSPADDLDEPDETIVVGASPAPRAETPAEPEGDGLSDEDRDLMDYAAMDIGRRDLRSMGLDPNQVERVIELRAQLTRG